MGTFQIVLPSRTWRQATYSESSSAAIPHSAFRGETPEERYFGTGTEIPSQLEAARKGARQARLQVNRALACVTCEPVPSITP